MLATGLEVNPDQHTNNVPDNIKDNEDQAGIQFQDQENSQDTSHFGSAMEVHLSALKTLFLYPDTRVQSGQSVMTRKEDDEISIALDPQV
ncbi:hypothetical protein Tco_1128737 [Tanacetum coccineum]